MYHVRLHYSHEGWAYHRRCLGIQKRAPDDFEVDIAQWHPGLCRSPLRKHYDLILNLVPDHPALTLALWAQGGGPSKTIIVGGLNVGWGHHDERLRMQESADHIVVNNRDLWERLNRPEGMTWISNGVDLDTFRVTRPVAERTPKVLWTGCSYHCDKTDIKGWHEILQPLMNSLDSRRIEYDFRMTDAGNALAVRSADDMVRWYNTGTIYICTSRNEGTPNPALEAAACGNVVLTTAVGNMTELIRQHVNGEIVNRYVSAFLGAIDRCIPKVGEMSEAMLGDMVTWDWSYPACDYYALFRNLIDERK